MLQLYRSKKSFDTNLISNIASSENLNTAYDLVINSRNQYFDSNSIANLKKNWRKIRLQLVGIINLKFLDNRIPQNLKCLRVMGIWLIFKKIKTILCKYIRFMYKVMKDLERNLNYNKRFMGIISKKFEFIELLMCVK